MQRHSQVFVKMQVQGQGSGFQLIPFNKILNLIVYTFNFLQSQ